MRSTHRALALFAGIFVLYMAATGTAIQSIDLSTLLRHAPATDPNMQSMREGINGPPNFQVIADMDYAAEPLSPSLDLIKSLSAVLRAVRQAAPSASLTFLEFRMQGGKPVAIVRSKDRDWHFDAASGAVLADEQMETPSAVSGPIKSGHNTLKNLHRLTAYGQWLTPLIILLGFCLCAFLLSGLWLYTQLYAARARLRKRRVFWLAGGWWRSAHRVLAIVTSAWILVVALSGTWLAIETVEIATYIWIHGQRPGLRADVSSPLQDSHLPAQLQTILGSQAAARPGVPIKVLRLRNFAGMPQGVVVSGTTASDTRQSAYSSTTGLEAPQSAPGYPPTGYSTGWQFHETIKRIHRGDYFGITGRWFDLITGLSIIFLSASGGAMYYSLWRQRERAGRKSLYWK